MADNGDWWRIAAHFRREEIFDSQMTIRWLVGWLVERFFVYLLRLLCLQQTDLPSEMFVKCILHRHEKKLIQSCWFIGKR